MASRFVPCRDLAHVLEMHDAGLLQCLWHSGWKKSTDGNWSWTSDSIAQFYKRSGWEENCWAILVEED